MMDCYSARDVTNQALVSNLRVLLSVMELPWMIRMSVSFALSRNVWFCFPGHRPRTCGQQSSTQNSIRDANTANTNSREFWRLQGRQREGSYLSFVHLHDSSTLKITVRENVWEPLKLGLISGYSWQFLWRSESIRSQYGRVVSTRSARVLIQLSLLSPYFYVYFFHSQFCEGL